MSFPSSAKGLKALLAAALVLPLSLHADDGAPALTLSDVRAHALSKSPHAYEIDAGLARGLSEAVRLRTLRNPELSASAAFPVAYEDERGENEVEVAVGQELRPSQFGLAQRVAELLGKGAESEAHAKASALLLEVSAQYYELWALGEEERHLEHKLREAREIGRAVERGAREGRGAPGEAKLFVAEAETLSADLLGIEAAREEASAALTARSGVALAGRRLEEPPRAPLPTFDALRSALQSNPKSVLSRQRAALELARERTALARRDAFPSLTPRVLYRHNDAGTDFVGFGISVPLPLFDRNGAERTKAQGELRAAAASAEFYESDTFNAQLKSALESARLKAAQAAAYRERVLPAQKDALRVANEQFRAGQGSVLQVWQLRRDYHEALDRSLALRIEAYRAALGMALLTGELSS